MHYNPTLLFCIFFLLFTSCKEKKSSVQTDLPSEFPHSPQTLTLLFCGDIMQHLPQIHSAHEPSEKDYKYRKCFKYIAPYWADADFVIANLETTLGNKDFSGYPRFCSPWQIARDLHQLGVTTFVTANNHSCDQLGKGIANTIYYLDSLKIPHTGTFTDTLSYQKEHPLYLKKNGFKINRTVFYLSIGFPKSCKIIASKPKNSTVRSFRASFASFWIVDNSML